MKEMEKVAAGPVFNGLPIHSAPATTLMQFLLIGKSSSSPHQISPSGRTKQGTVFITLHLESWALDGGLQESPDAFLGFYHRFAPYPSSVLK